MSWAGSLISILASISVFLISSAESRRAIFGLATRLRHPRVDPLLVEDDALDELGVGDRATLLLDQLDVVEVHECPFSAFSATAVTALTAMSPSFSRLHETPFEPIAVIATRFSVATSLTSTGSLIFWRTSCAFWTRGGSPWLMTVG